MGYIRCVFIHLHFIRILIYGIHFIHFASSSLGDPVIDIEVVSSRSKLTIEVQSKMVLNISSTGDGSSTEEDNDGLYLAVLSQHSGALLMVRRFPTSRYTDGLAAYPVVTSLAPGRVAVLAVKTDAALNLAIVTRRLLSQLGLHSAPYLQFRNYVACVLTVGSTTHGESVIFDDNPEYFGMYSSPVSLSVTIPQADPDECKWMMEAESARRIFCSTYDGYGDLCDCENPADIVEHEIALPYSVIEDVPLLIVAGNRPTELYRCLRTLLRQVGGSVSMIVVSLDSPQDEVLKLLQLLGIKHNIHNQIRGEQKVDGSKLVANRISAHYQSSIDLVFTMFPDAPSAIILEEDLLASPDFFRYFNQTAWLLAADESLFCISAWNDHGALHGSRDTTRLMRIESFPGNGWLLSRKVYTEIMHEWRKLDNVFDWDIWLRLEYISAQRECVVPEVSRVFHLGLTGAHVRGVMTQALFAGHLASMKYSNVLTNVHKMKQQEYEEEIYNIINDDQIVFLNVSVSPCTKQFIPKQYKHTVVFFFLMTVGRDSSTWSHVAACLGLWQLDTRGHHRGLFRFNFHGTSVLAIGYPFSDYSYIKPENVPMLRHTNSESDMSNANNIALTSRIRHRVPDLEPFVPSLMVQKPTSSPIWI